MKTHEPWLPPLPTDGQYWVVLSEIDARALVEGIVTNRVHQQARLVTQYLDTTAAVEPTPAE